MILELDGAGLGAFLAAGGGGSLGQFHAVLHEHAVELHGHHGVFYLLVAVVFICMAVLFAFFVVTRLRDNITFTTILTVRNIDDVAGRLDQQFKLRKIEVDRDMNTIIAFTKTTAFSWGEQLTLVVAKDHILVNSRPSGLRQPLTILKDRQNIKRLEQIL